MKEFELKYGCNPNQKPAKLYMHDGSDLSRDIRDKYVLSRLAFDLGLTEELLTKGIRK